MQGVSLIHYQVAHEGVKSVLLGVRVSFSLLSGSWRPVGWLVQLVSQRFLGSTESRKSKLMMIGTKREWKDDTICIIMKLLCCRQGSILTDKL